MVSGNQNCKLLFDKEIGEIKRIKEQDNSQLMSLTQSSYFKEYYVTIQA